MDVAEDYCCQGSRDWAKRLLFSPTYSIYCVTILIFTLSLFVWEMVIISNDMSPHHPLFISLEVLVVVALIAEVVLKVLAQQKGYLRQCGNLFDLFVIFSSIVVMVLFFSLSGKGKVFEFVGEGIDVVLLGFRYTVIFLRVVMVVKNTKVNFTLQHVGKLEINT
eukprot:TRINITY_DN2724_c0_g1_i3.p1 TRINITY_DN2724_c0_g1~~TRINITY_DN2724_c0_g1_i3.p1  ORF type:complete len:183 (-),score=23.78 TRINITY_DN2724_c0_g1_i3:1006-1497(-)